MTRMAVIHEKYLNELRAAGLLISEPFVSYHRAYPDGVKVGKPISVPGNSTGVTCGWGDRTGIYVDVAVLTLHCNGSKWFVESWDFHPGPGPGDFVNEWGTPEEAVSDILDFYFGSPARTDAKRKAWNIDSTQGNELQI